MARQPRGAPGRFGAADIFGDGDEIDAHLGATLPRRARSPLPGHAAFVFPYFCAT